MKKLLLLLALSSIYVCGFAQSSFGIKTGVNLASMSLDAEDNLGQGWDKAIHPVLSASVLGKIELSYTTNLMLELGLVQRGARFKAEESGLEGEISQTANQILFSPQIAFNASDEFLISIGPYIGHASKVKNKS